MRRDIGIASVILTWRSVQLGIANMSRAIANINIGIGKTPKLEIGIAQMNIGIAQMK